MPIADGVLGSSAVRSGLVLEAPRLLIVEGRRPGMGDCYAVVLCDKTGLSLFDELHSGRRDRDVILYAFDLLELNGKDQRNLALEERKARLGDLLIPLAGAIELSEHLEGDGATIFRHACKLGCEGIVSKQRASHYRSGRTRSWIKAKNPNCPAMTRVWER